MASSSPVGSDATTPTRGTRLLLLSSSLEPDPGAVSTAGIDLVMSKPVLSGRLVEAITGLLGATPIHGDDLRETRWADDAGTGSPGAPMAGRVLLVEDNPVNQLVAEGDPQHSRLPGGPRREW
ncbi:hypothetical protein [Nostocoides sp. HKS02]|uniref:hypothetical protein n=1 Tax=Nostocoides sp. HKS02 TaxID=1813880 RepID=UPI00272A3F0A|nr:hypothetical protein [Tetrasphaera sp. HKS02]